LSALLTPAGFQFPITRTAQRRPSPALCAPASHRRHRPPRNRATELRRQADQFIDLADLEPIISREPSTRNTRAPNGHGRTARAKAPATDTATYEGVPDDEL
jgi:hypothetical protein